MSQWRDAGGEQAAAETAIDPKVPSKGNISMRVGFDVGPVVGHLVGRKHKKYTIFGNTVNTASRSSAVFAASCACRRCALVAACCAELASQRLRS
eukprot:2429932-Rhodomonas_salina.1